MAKHESLSGPRSTYSAHPLSVESSRTSSLKHVVYWSHQSFDCAGRSRVGDTVACGSESSIFIPEESLRARLW